MLRQVTDPPAQGREAETRRIDVIDARVAAGRRQQARHQLQQGRFAAGLAAADGDHGARLDRQRSLGEQRVAPGVVGERQVIQHEPSLRRIGRQRTAAVLHGHGEQRLRLRAGDRQVLQPQPGAEHALNRLDRPAGEKGAGGQPADGEPAMDHHQAARGRRRDLRQLAKAGTQR